MKKENFTNFLLNFYSKGTVSRDFDYCVSNRFGPVTHFEKFFLYGLESAEILACSGVSLIPRSPVLRCPWNSRGFFYNLKRLFHKNVGIVFFIILTQLDPAPIRGPKHLYVKVQSGL